MNHSLALSILGGQPVNLPEHMGTLTDLQLVATELLRRQPLNPGIWAALVLSGLTSQIPERLLLPVTLLCNSFYAALLRWLFARLTHVYVSIIYFNEINSPVL